MGCLAGHSGLFVLAPARDAPWTWDVWINFRCHRDATKQNLAPARAVSCGHDPRLTVFAKQKNNQPVLTQELQDWAMREGHVHTTETQVLP